MTSKKPNKAAERLAQLEIELSPPGKKVYLGLKNLEDIIVSWMEYVYEHETAGREVYFLTGLLAEMASEYMGVFQELRGEYDK